MVYQPRWCEYAVHPLCLLLPPMASLPKDHSKNLSLTAEIQSLLILSNSPCKKDSTRGNGMRKGANFCTTLLLFYHTSDWLNQQNLPKLQVPVYLFILN